MDHRDGELLIEFDPRRHPVTWWSIPPPKSETRVLKQMLLRKKDNKLWHRFIILPNIEGQQYTIGNPFITRVEESEFICLPCSENGWELLYGNQTMFNLCEITCLEGRYMVTPTQVGSIYINDVKVDGRTQLKFGDRIGLRKVLWDGSPPPIQLYKIGGSKGTKARKQQEEKVVSYENRDADYWQIFLFSERELDPEAFNTSKYSPDYGFRHLAHFSFLTTPEERKKLNDDKLEKCIDFFGNFPPGDNELILSRILIHLDFAELKSTRLVSQIFNREALKLITKRGYGRLDFRIHKHMNLMTALRYANEMKDCPMPTWKLKLPKLYDSKKKLFGSKEALEFENKMKYDIKSFSNLYMGSCVTVLKLSGPIHSSSDWECRMQILQNLSTTLVEICFSGTSESGNIRDPRKMAYVQEILKFKKLQKFTLALDTPWSWERSNWRYQANRNHVNVTPRDDQVFPVSGIRSLGLISETAWTNIFVNFSASFPHLEEVTIRSLSLIGLQFLSKLTRPLKLFILTGLLDFGQEHLPQFEQLLEKHSKSLLTLEFMLPKFVKEMEMAPLRLPVFEVLINLKIGFLADGHMRRVCTTIEFGADNIPPFEKYLTSLKSLTLSMVVDSRETHFVSVTNAVVWEEFGVLFEAFFPFGDDCEVPPKYRNLRILDIPYELCFYSAKESHAGVLLPRGVKIAAMFPNVVNRWMNKIRETGPISNPVLEVSQPKYMHPLEIKVRKGNKFIPC